MAVTSIETENWSAPGAKDSMAKTYAAIQTALNKSENLKTKDIEVFLQGSYANATNIRGDADVDVVVMLKSSWVADTSLLSTMQKQAYDVDHVGVSYGAKHLRADAHAALSNHFGTSRIDPCNKCIHVLKAEGYVDADVVPAIQHRIYTNYDSVTKGRYLEGLKIYTQKGPVIVNFPKVHKSNGEAKNIATNENFKPSVRQLKQLKRRLVSAGKIDSKLVPGYLIECMTYNVPDSLFVNDHHSRLLKIISWLISADFTDFKSVDGIHKLFVTDPGQFSASAAKNLVLALAGEMVD